MSNTNQTRFLAGGISSLGRKLPCDDINFLKAHGAYIWDTNQRSYIDTVLGYGSNMLGHGVEPVVDALINALRRGSMPGIPHYNEEIAARLVTEQTLGNGQAVFVNSGSEAVHLACNISRYYKHKPRIVKLYGGYHGWYDGQLINPEVFAEQIRLGDFLDIGREISVIHVNDLQALEKVFSYHRDIAAIIVEPVMANSGCLMLNKAFIDRLNKIVQSENILLIADEVLTGFRLIPGLSCTEMGLNPDIVTLGKAIGNGFPVAAVVGKNDIMKVIDTGELKTAGTYNGNPLACEAVIATLRQLQQKDYPRLLNQGNALRSMIELQKTACGQAITTSGTGSFFSIWFSEAPPENYSEACDYCNDNLSQQLYSALKDHGVLTMPNSFGRVFLSFSHTKDIMAQLADAFSSSLSQISSK